MEIIIPQIAYEEIEEINDIWKEYRTIAKNGISKYADDIIRDLLARFSLLQSQAEIVLGIAETKLSAEKVKLDNFHSMLLQTKYNSGTVSARKLSADGDAEFLLMKESYNLVENDFVLARQIAKAYAVASANLSRELTPRSKY